MPTDDQTLCVHFLAARSAAGDLRSWVVKHYFLQDSQLDINMTTTLRQLDHVVRSETFYGYDISQAPPALLTPIRHYIRLLWDGQRTLSGEHFPKKLFLKHKRISEITEATHIRHKGQNDA